jgi:hypothetical protein
LSSALVETGETLTLTYTGLGTNGNNINIIIEWGDGLSTTLFQPLNTNDQFTHIYTNTGTFTINFNLRLFGTKGQLLCKKKATGSVTVETADEDCPIFASFNYILFCDELKVKLISTTSGGDGDELFTWDMGNGDILYGSSVFYEFINGGIYNVTLTVDPGQAVPPECEEFLTFSSTLDLSDCFNCEECLPSFSPLPGKEYVLSAWVTADDPYVESGDGGCVVLDFPNTGVSLGPFCAQGSLVEGWRRIEENFTVPQNATKINVKLINTVNQAVYFDDVRIHPFNGSMKSYVYNGENFRLMAELDENNYATFYEYDEEGSLVRIKKETERGIMTLQETRNKLTKLFE